MPALRFGSRPSYDGRLLVLDDDLRLRTVVQVIVDFGVRHGGAEDTIATATVAAPWVRADTRLLCTPAGDTTPDHDPYDAAAEGISAYPSQVVPGVGFDVIVSAPTGAWGRYLINVTGN